MQHVERVDEAEAAIVPLLDRCAPRTLRGGKDPTKHQLHFRIWNGVQGGVQAEPRDIIAIGGNNGYSLGMLGGVVVHEGHGGAIHVGEGEQAVERLAVHRYTVFRSEGVHKGRERNRLIVPRAGDLPRVVPFHQEYFILRVEDDQLDERIIVLLGE